MQPHGAMWKPNPQPSRTNAMTASVCCARTDENGKACAAKEKDDASTPQVRTNDHLANIDRSLLEALRYAVVGEWKPGRPFCHGADGETNRLSYGR